MSDPPKYRTPNSRARTAAPLISSLSNLPAERDMFEGLVPSPIRSVARPRTSADTDENEIRVKDLEYIGSYNWVEAQKPTIIVPGKIACN